MTSTATEVHRISLKESRNCSVDFTNSLDSSVLLTGAPTITGDVSLTISNEQVSAEILTINDVSVAVGKAVQFSVSAATVGLYEIEILASSDDGETIEGNVILDVEA